jgi:hypothetical protein
MKKLLFVLLLSFASVSMHAQVKANGPGPYYGNGDSYGFYIDEIPGAVSYVWSVQGTTGAVIWPASWTETAIDLTFSYQGMCDVICTVTMDNGSEVVYSLSVDVYEE